MTGSLHTVRIGMFFRMLPGGADGSGSSEDG